MPAEEYIPLVVRELERHKRLADRALAQLPAEYFFETPGAGDNSVATIMKHMNGNMLSRWKDFLTSDGEKPDRRRDEEFVVLPDDTREKILARWEEAWATLLGALAPLGTSDLDRIVTIRGEELTVLQAINRQFTHYPYHIGQIVYLAKHYAGAKWKSLTIPVGGSEQFNKAPTKYLRKP